MQDTQRMEQYLASIDRLTQRLVVLSEEGRKSGDKTARHNAPNAPSEPHEPDGEQQTTEKKRAAAAAERERRLLEEQNNTQDDINKENKISFKLLNDMLDGSKQLNADTRQFLSNFVSVSADIVNDFASFESASEQALAASKGVLTAGQTAKLAMGEIANASRNIAQFGVIAGGMMSAVSAIATYMRRQQEKLEHKVRVAISNENNDREIEQIRGQLDQGKTPLELELANRKGELKDIAQARTRFNELNVKFNESYAEYQKYQQELYAQAGAPGGNYGFAPAYANIAAPVKSKELKRPETYLNQKDADELKREKKNKILKAPVKSEELKTLETYLNQKDADELKRTQENKKLETQIELKTEQDARLYALNEEQVKLDAELYKLETASYVYRNDAKRKAYEAKAEALEKLLHKGNDDEILPAILDARSQALELAITGVKQNFDLELAKLKANPPKDKAGNTLQVELQAAETALLKKLQDGVRKQTLWMPNVTKIGKDWTYGGEKVSLTDEKGIDLRAKQSEAKSKIAKELDSTKAGMLERSLKTQENIATDQLNRFNNDVSAPLIGIANKSTIAIKRVVNGIVDPVSAIEAKEKALQETLTLYERQSKGLVGEAAASANAKIKEVKDSILKVQADKVLAKRQLEDQFSQYRMGELDFFMSASQGLKGLTSTRNAGDIADQRRQLQNSQGPAGAFNALMLENAEQRRQFAVAQKLREERIAKVKNELASLKEGTVSDDTRARLEQQITALTRESELAKLAQANELTKQAASSTYRLKNDKATFERFNRVIRIGATTDYMKKGPLKERGLSGGAEHAKLTSDFNEMFRRRRGKLTDEEQAAAKEERSLNNQLERSKRAVAKGGGTRKQKDLVAYYNNAKEAEKPVVEKILESVDKALTHLSIMSGKKN